MTSEAINAAIAEACGWRPPSETECSKPAEFRHSWFNPDDGCCYQDVPDYVNDLNAIGAAMAFIPQTRRGQFNAELSLLTSGRNLSAAVREPEFIFYLVNSTARNRAVAFLKALNKWKDT
jgi:hypothetical protein